MLESQLFGHRRGAFTGADRDHPGMIGAARDGTLFLDEIGELGLDLQPKLLRFLESGEICPLGEPTPFTVNVRIVAATNANLEQLVARRPLPRGPVLPPERRSACASRRCASGATRFPALVRHFVARVAARIQEGRRRASPKKRWSTCCSAAGRATSASCRTRSAAWSRSPSPNAVLTPDDLSEDVFNAAARARPAPHPATLEMVVAAQRQAAADGVENRARDDPRSRSAITTATSTPPPARSASRARAST